MKNQNTEPTNYKTNLNTPNMIVLRTGMTSMCIYDFSKICAASATAEIKNVLKFQFAFSCVGYFQVMWFMLMSGMHDTSCSHAASSFKSLTNRVDM